VLTALLRAGLKGSQVGVITPYDGQRAFISASLQRMALAEAYGEVEVASVDAFQGREKDFIILTCVRCDGNLQSY